LKTLILYRTFLGSSKKYAGWLHEAVDSDTMKYSKADARVLAQYYAVVIFGGTYAGHLSTAGYIKKNWETLKGKHVVLVTVAGAPDTEAVSVKAYSEIPEDVRSAVKHFHLRGKFGKTNAAEVTPDRIKPIADYLKSL
jgi:menaquinone-dependent protoporphyrinogen IX oxidase